MELFHFDLARTIDHIIHLMVAYGLALPLGMDREVSKFKFGLRTFPLVGVVSCGFMLVGMSVIDSTEGEARIFEGIITGIGFIGGGAIITSKDKIMGTSSAASIWNTGAIGLAVAYNRLEIAIVLSVLNVLTLWTLHSIKKTIEKRTDEEE